MKKKEKNQKEKAKKQKKQYAPYSHMSRSKQYLFIAGFWIIALLAGTSAFFEWKMLLSARISWRENPISWLYLAAAAGSTFCFLWTIWYAERLRRFSVQHPSAVSVKSGKKGGVAEIAAKSLGLNESYEKKLRKLQSLARYYQSSQEKIMEMVEEHFFGSSLTVRRYLDTIEAGRKTVESNYEEARKAVELFEPGSKPTPQRTALLDSYIESSCALLDKLAEIETSLAEMRQESSKKKQKYAGEDLEELASTAKYYAESKGGTL